jgi:hypothetical protein
MQPLIPTQLQLTAEQRARLRRLAQEEGKTVSEVAREAIDAYTADRADPVEPVGRYQPFRALAASSSSAWERA